MTSTNLNMIKAGNLADNLNFVADWYECGKDQNKMMRQEAVAQMILGEDAEEVGGHILTNDIFAMKKIAACGKLQACFFLQNLMQIIFLQHVFFGQVFSGSKL